MSMVLRQPPERYDVEYERERNLTLELADAESWKKTGDVDHPLGLLVRGKLKTTLRTPASASATGAEGEIAWDADYIYICTATDTWKRVAIATW